MCGRSRGSADSRDGSVIVEPMASSEGKESWRVMISIQFFKNHFLLRAEEAGVRVSVHGGFLEEGLVSHHRLFPGLSRSLFSTSDTIEAVSTAEIP